MTRRRYYPRRSPSRSPSPDIQSLRALAVATPLPPHRSPSLQSEHFGGSDYQPSHNSTRPTTPRPPDIVTTPRSASLPELLSADENATKYHLPRDIMESPRTLGIPMSPGGSVVTVSAAAAASLRWLGTPSPKISPALSVSYKSKVSIRESRDPVAPPRISDAYNFPDWNVEFAVGGHTIYRVHKYFFRRESPILARILDDSPEGKPVPLSGITCAEFDALLEFMYSAIFESDPISIEKCLSILHISNMWSMARVKAQVVKRLDAMKSLTPVERILTAAREEVEEWILPALFNLVEREEPLSVPESRQLISLGERRVGPVDGIDVVPLLAQARERVRKRPVTAEKIVGEVFGYFAPVEPSLFSTPRL